MIIQRIAAFSDGHQGGNPAGVVLCEALPDAATMQAAAAEVGYAETAFAALEGDAWRVRYFAPEMEIPFCGHATIALGAALAMQRGDGTFPLRLNAAAITVEGWRDGALMGAALESPPTRSEAASPALASAVLDLFGIVVDDLDGRLPAALINAGAQHLVLALRDRERLRGMHYALDAGRTLMKEAGLVTIMLVVAQSPDRFDARHAFAAGGLLEDPATGAGAAAFAGYLRDLGWPHGGAITITQGEDMGMTCRLHAAIPAMPGSSIRVSGTARMLEGG